MPDDCASLSRRSFLSALGALGVAAAARSAFAAEARPGVKLGIDNFAVRAHGWKAPRLIDYANELRVDSLLISDLDAFESLDSPYLASLRRKAEDSGLQLHVGSWSICPSSTTFRSTWGTAEEHLATCIRVAKELGSPVVRVILGNSADRRTPGGIRARIADTVKVLKSQRSRAIDAGVKIAVENHAGDMQAWELVSLIEEAGKDYVGANLDSGNAAWTMEDPLVSLETLGPYALTTSLRDCAVWESENGATVQWTAMGAGDLDLKAYFARFVELCPGVPVHIETISGFNREIPFLQPDHWQAFPEARAKDLAAFLALARKGKPREPFPPAGSPQAEQDRQRSELERSIEYCRETLGLGVRR